MTVTSWDLFLKSSPCCAYELTHRNIATDCSRRAYVKHRTIPERHDCEGLGQLPIPFLSSTARQRVPSVRLAIRLPCETTPGQ